MYLLRKIYSIVYYRKMNFAKIMGRSIYISNASQKYNIININKNNNNNNNVIQHHHKFRNLNFGVIIIILFSSQEALSPRHSIQTSHRYFFFHALCNLLRIIITDF